MMEAYIHTLEAEIAGFKELTQKQAQQLAEYQQTYDVRFEDCAALGGMPGYALVLPCGFVYRIERVTLFKKSRNPVFLQNAKFKEVMKAMTAWLGLSFRKYEEIAVELRDHNDHIIFSIVCTPLGHTHFRYITHTNIENMTTRNAEYIIRKLVENFEIAGLST
jgi:hypothetical protein